MNLFYYVGFMQYYSKEEPTYLRDFLNFINFHMEILKRQNAFYNNYYLKRKHKEI